MSSNANFDVSDEPEQVSERKQRENSSGNTQTKALFGHTTIIPNTAGNFIKNPAESDNRIQGDIPLRGGKSACQECGSPAGFVCVKPYSAITGRLRRIAPDCTSTPITTSTMNKIVVPVGGRVMAPSIR